MTDHEVAALEEWLEHTDQYPGMVYHVMTRDERDAVRVVLCRLKLSCGEIARLGKLLEERGHGRSG